MSEQKLQFQAEVSRLLDIVAHSLYSEKEIFLRELISNASDACDRLRYAALTQPHLLADDPDLKVVVSIDRKAGAIEVADNGIGMNREDLVENLGTIARSGTAAFLSQVPAEEAKGVSLIGQFGVGFYSAFISGAQRLPNGNTLICSGAAGRLFEVTREGRIVWDYRNPLGGDVDPPDHAGKAPPLALFRGARYAKDHPGVRALLE